MRHLIVATLRRGVVDPPEPVDFQNQCMIDAKLEAEAFYVSQERDPAISQWRQRQLAKQPQTTWMYGPARDLLMRLSR